MDITKAQIEKMATEYAKLFDYGITNSTRKRFTRQRE